MRLGCVDGEVREHLAVELDAGGLEAAHQLRVGEPVLARRGVDADDPEAAVLALLVLAADVGVLRRRFDRFFRCAIQLALGLEEAFGARKSFLRFARRTVPRLTRGIRLNL